ncbi:Putative arrestin-like, immunoglobulin E-set [Septoria linicola]|uniref:Arrestin-like, immunoglobulin E-set n=1 Tax=Septoria linicola TaxID=215465 RepID=A0A9Q9EPA6_9PEZI|nr:Putative arrestin-like, immunoglobulin E-set [Septoria linicola]
MPATPARNPSNTPSTTNNSTPNSGRRFISRLTSPFASKSRKLTDFYIQVDDPHRSYAQGDSVTGCVNLKVVQPIRVTHVVVCLHGFVQVYKNPGSPPADGYRATSAHIGTGRGSKSGEYFGNGFASLFEDEVVLCGDGKLGEGVYQFRFDLLFPDRDLPSSISFERGTISYMITATLTRPTTISPTIQCDHKVYMVERIDVSQMLPPKARTITLEPISRRSKAKTQARRLAEHADRKSRRDGSGTTSGERDRRTSQSSSALSSHADAVDAVPQSPAPTEGSFDSYLSSSIGRPSQQDSNMTSPRHSDGENGSARRTITATVESLTGGVLRGDSIAVKVHVNHTKHVKSLHGVIITLYRQARVDLHPAIPLGPTEKGKEAKYEDYYPKSVTGLGGLSLSGAGSSHMFRKDLSQTIVPLIVDPTSLTAEVTGRVHVPEGAFPTISSVPGAMISFRYYVECVLDIQGKLQTQDRNLGNLGGLASTMLQGQGTESLGTERSGVHPFSSPVIDTAAVRRDKGVVACTFEVVVGTRDNSRQKGKRKVSIPEEPEPEPTPTQAHPEADAQAGAAQQANGQWQDDYWNHSGTGYDHVQGYDQRYPVNSPYAHTNGNGYDGYHGYNDYYGGYAQYDYPPPDTHYIEPPPPMPIPQMEDESQLSEKERMRRAEQRLLPSQPPGMEDPAGSSSHAATAPHLPDELPNGSGTLAPAPALLTPPAYGHLHAHPNGMLPIDYARTIPLPRTPDYEPREAETMSAAGSATPRTTPHPAEIASDDKRELQRRQLQMEASAPPVAAGEELDTAGSSSRTPAPSAPTLTNEDLYGNDDDHVDMSTHSDLPRYER